MTKPAKKTIKKTDSKTGSVGWQHVQLKLDGAQFEWLVAQALPEEFKLDGKILKSTVVKRVADIQEPPVERKRENKYRGWFEVSIHCKIHEDKVAELREESDEPLQRIIKNRLAKKGMPFEAPPYPGKPPDESND